MAQPHAAQISGYNAAPSPEAIDALNKSKAIQELLNRVCDQISGTEGVNPDPRLMNVAKTQFELGFLALGKAVMKPGATTSEQVAKYLIQFENLVFG